MTARTVVGLPSVDTAGGDDTRIDLDINGDLNEDQFMSYASGRRLYCRCCVLRAPRLVLEY